MKRLYVKCPICGLVFPSGFSVKSPIQLIGFSYLCPKCQSIVPCDPPEYLEKVGEEFTKAMENEGVYALPPLKRIAIKGPDLFPLSEEIKVEDGILMLSNKAFVKFKVKE